MVDISDIPSFSFEEKVKIFERIYKKCKIDPDTGCWLWQGTKTKDGYGMISIRGKEMKVHRVMAALFGEVLTEDDLIRHFECSERSCNCPHHLRVGTPADNSQDMVNSGRSLKGELNPASKLKKEEARSIIKDERKTRLIAEQYDVSTSHVRAIQTGKRWTHLHTEVKAETKFSKRLEALTLENFTAKAKAKAKATATEITTVKEKEETFTVIEF